MKIGFFYHSLLSDWNHGNAHFLRGVARELAKRGHHVTVYEPKDSWSYTNLVREHGMEPVRQVLDRYPGVVSRRYGEIELESELQGVDLVIVHEWNSPKLVKRIGECRAKTQSFALLFHDTHHRAVTAPEEMAAYDLTEYDGVLAYGAVLREIYLERGWAAQAWTWHEAADVTVFHPHEDIIREHDLVWIGNWGDDERTAELHEFLIDPVRDLGLDAQVHGVRYPEEARSALADAGIRYRGWLANLDVPPTFARYRVTVHVPRRAYTEALPGIPTIRPFEALACGIPLVSAPWQDTEGLFRAGTDFLVAGDGREMRGHLHRILNEPSLANELATRGRETILARHTCSHRVDELFTIVSRLRARQVEDAAMNA